MNRSQGVGRGVVACVTPVMREWRILRGEWCWRGYPIHIPRLMHRHFTCKHPSSIDGCVAGIDCLHMNAMPNKKRPNPMSLWPGAITINRYPASIHPTFTSMHIQLTFIEYPNLHLCIPNLEGQCIHSLPFTRIHSSLLTHLHHSTSIQSHPIHSPRDVMVAPMISQECFPYRRLDRIQIRIHLRSIYT